MGRDFRLLKARLSSAIPMLPPPPGIASGTSEPAPRIPSTSLLLRMSVDAGLPSSARQPMAAVGKMPYGPSLFVAFPRLIRSSAQRTLSMNSVLPEIVLMPAGSWLLLTISIIQMGLLLSVGIGELNAKCMRDVFDPNFIGLGMTYQSNTFAMQLGERP
jgi:hypothetical protein